MWRCFQAGFIASRKPPIFSTYVEVFPQPTIIIFSADHFLHVCGGVSMITGKLRSTDPIFSTYVEVFLLPKPFAGRFRNFLHVCGGVSSGYLVPFFVDEFSPRMWRCFFVKVTTTVAGTIFSTYVEVFLMLNRGALNGGNFLHVCGGVSFSVFQTRRIRTFSPRMWRCFSARRYAFCARFIFSTYVEVFPSF